MSQLDLQATCNCITDIAVGAGEVPRKAQSSFVVVTSKKNTADIVTEVDRDVEDSISQRLARQYSTHDIVGEDSYKQGDTITYSPTFVVDPTDGTSNFVHGFPDVCISVGLAADQRPTVGVVYNPVHDELWYAHRDAGSYVRKHGVTQRLPLAAAPLRGLQQACIGIEFGSHREEGNFELNMHVFKKLLRTQAGGDRFVNSLRATGSAAITICRVAAGQQDALWERGCWLGLWRRLGALWRKLVVLWLRDILETGIRLSITYEILQFDQPHVVRRNSSETFGQS